MQLGPVGFRTAEFGDLLALRDLIVFLDQELKNSFSTTGGAWNENTSTSGGRSGS